MKLRGQPICWICTKDLKEKKEVKAMVHRKCWDKAPKVEGDQLTLNLMPTDTELKRRGCPTVCTVCYGFGFYDFSKSYKGQEVKMSLAGARMNFRTRPCRACGADPCPKGEPNEPLKR